MVNRVIFQALHAERWKDQVGGGEKVQVDKRELKHGLTVRKEVISETDLK